MTATIIDGKAIAEDIRNKVNTQVHQLIKQHNITPGLAVILVGDDSASQVYVRNKARFTTEAGMRSFESHLPINTSQSELLAEIEKHNINESVNAILVQLPLPKHIDERKIINAINPDKDVDGFHEINSGRLANNLKATVPCTPLGCLHLIKTIKPHLDGLKALVVGRSNIVGKPMAQLLLQENCTVTIAHSRTNDLSRECVDADIVVVAVGKPNFIKGEWLKESAIVIDVGINRQDTKEGKTILVGDVDFKSAVQRVHAITPVPGGVGPMTIAFLLKNTLDLTLRQHNIKLK